MSALSVKIGVALIGVAIGTSIVIHAMAPPPTELTEQQKQIITQRVATEILHGQLLYGLPELHRPSVGFVKEGHDAAQALCAYSLVSDGVPAWSLRINEPLAAAHYRRFLRETLPHEVAHLLLCQIGPYWQTHDDRWSSIVRDMGATPKEFHDYAE